MLYRPLLLLLASALLFGQAEEERILGVLERQQAAWNRGDIEAFLDGYERSDRVAFVGTDVQHGFDALRARYQRQYGSRTKMGALRFSDLEVRILNDSAATVIGRFHLTRSQEGGGDASGIFSIVLVKVKGQWRIVLDHTSS